MTTTPIHLAITDSGVGGLSACALVEHALRTVVRARGARITYFNVWPSEGGGYNDLPDIAARAAVFDRALEAMAARTPQQIVIACNTLSIVYAHTHYRRAANPPAPVLGIVDAGVQLFHSALAARPGSAIALFGTKTTIESGVHRRRLMGCGIEPSRIIPVGCHGLAKSIETEMDGTATSALIEECSARAAEAIQGAEPTVLYLGICCTHYTYLREQMQATLQHHSRRQAEVLDPVDRLVDEVLAGARARKEIGKTAADGREAARGQVTVKVVSKVKMSDAKRRLIADRIRTTSPATADAVLSYQHVPDLF